MIEVSMRKNLYTVTKFARLCGVSRTTVLYYEKEGLLKPQFRSDNNYRWYCEDDVAHLKEILALRAFGLAVKQIKSLLNSVDKNQQNKVLTHQFFQLEKEISRLKKQQLAIVVTLQEPALLSDRELNKERWVAIMKSLSFDEGDMVAWHQTFEQLKPEAHLRFLQSLGIDEHEIKRIRAL